MVINSLIEKAWNGLRRQAAILAALDSRGERSQALRMFLRQPNINEDYITLLEEVAAGTISKDYALAESARLIFGYPREE
jgi:hypothetical protein